MVKHRLVELENEGRLLTCIIPGGLTSVLQLGDLVVNGPCKKFLRKGYQRWQFSEIRRRRATGEKGRLVIKVTRELLMTWNENFVDDFNFRERSGMTNIIEPCLTKVGQNPFTEDTDPFLAWLETLNKNALYKSLLEAHTAENL